MYIEIIIEISTLVVLIKALLMINEISLLFLLSFAQIKDCFKHNSQVMTYTLPICPFSEAALTKIPVLSHNTGKKIKENYKRCK